MDKIILINDKMVNIENIELSNDLLINSLNIYISLDRYVRDKFPKYTILSDYFGFNMIELEFFYKNFNSIIIQNMLENFHNFVPINMKLMVVCMIEELRKHFRLISFADMDNYLKTYITRTIY